MVCCLAQHERCATPGGANVLLEVGQVDALPEVLCCCLRFFFGELRIAVEVGVGIGEGTALQAEESLLIPRGNILCSGIDIDGEVEEVTHS